MSDPTEYVLGLDLGAASVGWAMIATRDGCPVGLIRSGVRVFEAGVAGDLEAGRTEPRNAKRRQACQARRQTDRRRRRLRKVFHILQGAGLLPQGDPAQVVPGLDHEVLRARSGTLQSSEQRHQLAQVLPLWLRAQALDRKLEAHELGRALYHLAQRRGFLSNRKSAPKEDEDEGQLKRAIGELETAIAQQGARTLGEYLAGLDPDQARIRTRKTSREMYVREFDAIWQAQALHHGSLLNEGLRERLRGAIFHQRPLKSVAGLVGACELEPGRQRAPWALLEAQRFRLLQKVNDIRLTDMATGELRPLDADERQTLVLALEHQGDLKFGEAKKVLGRKPGELHFNLEEGGEQRLLGNRTSAALASVFGTAWWAMTAEDQAQVVTDVLTIDSETALYRRATHRWQLAPEAAARFAVLTLQPGYCSFSRVALRKLLPHLEAGLSLAEACDLVYKDRRKPADPVDHLPRVEESLPTLRNPVVARVLTELRKVLNAVVREHGKPALVRIELAREVKRSNRAREEAAKRMRDQERKRAAASGRVVQEAGVAQPSRDDVEKMLLWEECGGHCPYTGKPIPFAALFGPNPEFDVEHIIPFCRSFDNSFVNKTLCHVEENRRVKRNRTPWEAYHGTPQYDEVLARVRAFQGARVREKLRRFQLQEVGELDDFTTRELNDTRWASRLAADYVATLFGGRVDASGRLRVQVSAGQLTAFLRGALNVSGLVPTMAGSKRLDHRHHAVDAVTIALTSPAAVKALADSAQRSWGERQRLFSRLDEPWPEFVGAREE